MKRCFDPTCRRGRTDMGIHVFGEMSDYDRAEYDRQHPWVKEAYDSLFQFAELPESVKRMAPRYGQRAQSAARRRFRTKQRNILANLRRT